MNVGYWHDGIMARVQDLDHAIETATERMEEGDLDSIIIEEVRPPGLDDIDYAELTDDVIDWLSERIEEATSLTWDDGWPVMARLPTPGVHYDALTAAVTAYVREHVDISDAAWVPTGRMLHVSPDGQWWIEGGLDGETNEKIE